MEDDVHTNNGDYLIETYHQGKIGLAEAYVRYSNGLITGEIKYDRNIDLQIMSMVAHAFVREHGYEMYDEKGIYELPVDPLFSVPQDYFYKTSADYPPQI